MLGLKWRMLVVGLACATMALPAAAQSISTDRNGRIIIQVPERDQRSERRDGQRRDYYRDPDVRVYDRQPERRDTYRRNPRNSHVEWCMGRYRSYDAGSNSYRGSDGRRHRCSSPYS